MLDARAQGPGMTTCCYSASGSGGAASGRQSGANGERRAGARLQLRPRQALEHLAHHEARPA